MSAAVMARPAIGPHLADTFTRADSTTTLGSAESGQAWTVGAGTWGISSNKAYLVSATGHATAWCDTGLSDNYIVSADITTSPNADSTDVSILFRLADTSNFLNLNIFDLAGTNALRFSKRAAGTFTTLTTRTGLSFAANTTYHVALAVQNDELSVAVDGEWMFSHVLSPSDLSTYGSNTKIGFRINRQAGGDDGGTRIDNLKVTAMAGVGRVTGDYNGATVFRVSDAFTLAPSGTNLREQDSIVYDPNDPNLGTNPERLYKFYYGDPVSTPELKVLFSPDGVQWSAPVTTVQTGVTLREDMAVVQMITPRGQVYRDGLGRMWGYAENSSNGCDVGYSTDGINWFSAGGNPAIPLGSGGAWDESLVGSPTALTDGTNFFIIYEGVDAGGIEQSGIAIGTSPNSLTKSAANPIFLASDPWVNNSAICDTAYLNEDGTKFVFLLHDGPGTGTPTKRMFRATTTNLDPSTWTSGDITFIKTNEPQIKNDFTVDHSTPGAYAFITGNNADTLMIRVSALPLT